MPIDDHDETPGLAEAAAILRGSGRPPLQALWPLLLVWGSACVVIGVSLAAFGTARPTRIVMAAALLTGAAVSVLIMQLAGWGIYGRVLGRLRAILGSAVIALGAVGLAVALVPAPTVAGVPTVWAASVAALAVGTAWGLATTLVSRHRLFAAVSVVWVVFFVAIVAVGLPIAAYVLIAGGAATLIGAIPARTAEIRALLAPRPLPPEP